MRTRSTQAVIGAPNARGGASHHGNPSARAALSEGVLDILASDYHPPSLLAAAYALAAGGACSWAEVMALVTVSPARAARLDSGGDIAAGMRADLVAVGRRRELPSVPPGLDRGQEVFTP